RVTSGAPAATRSPLSKWTRSTTSLTLAVTSTDSRAWTVPSARMLSLKGTGATVVVVTTAAGAPPCPPAPPSAPQAPSAIASRTAQHARRRALGIGFGTSGMVWGWGGGQAPGFYRPRVSATYAMRPGAECAVPVNRWRAGALRRTLATGRAHARPHVPPPTDRTKAHDPREHPRHHRPHPRGATEPHRARGRCDLRE